MEKARPDLKLLFRDGARPTGSDFGDFLDSFVHRGEDGISFKSGNPEVSNFTLGNFTATPNAGSMRYSTGEVQFYDGSIWKNVSSNALGFRPLNEQPASAQADAAYFGKVGINLGASPTALVDDFEVGVVKPATALINKARVGEAVIGGDEGGRALFFSRAMRTTTINGGDVKLNYALAQSKAGGVSVNSVKGQAIRFCTDDAPQMVFKDGQLLLSTSTPLVPLPPLAPGDTTPILLHVAGHAIKQSGGASWLVTSDIRTKKDITEFSDGLSKLKELKAFNFRYNGKGGTKENLEQIGFLGQEVEKVLPYMVKRMGNTATENDGSDFPEDMILLDSSPLVYILVNAVRELDEKIQKLQNN